MQFRLRTLLIALTLGPALLAMIWIHWPIMVAAALFGLTAAIVLFCVSALLPSD